MPSDDDDRPTTSPFPALIFSKLYRRYFPLLMGLAGRILYMLILRQENAAFWWKIFQSQSEIYRMRCKENSLSAPDSSFMRVKSFASVGIFSEKALT